MIFRLIININPQTLRTQELLRYLEKLEIGLSSFSYEELGVVEAGELKKSFEIFKHGLEDKVFGVSEMKQLEDICQRVGIVSPERKSVQLKEQDQLMVLIERLENTPLTQEQRNLIKNLREVAKGQSQTEYKTPNPMPPNFQCIEKSMETGFSVHKINLKPVLEDCMGRMELLEEMVRMFKLNVLEFIGSARVHLMKEDFGGLEQACQKISPSLRMMQSRELMEVVQQMALLSKTDNDTKHLAFLYDQFVMEYPMVQEQVDFEMEMFRTM